MKKTFAGTALLLALSLLPSCSKTPTTNSTTSSRPSGLKVRAFISNPLFPTGAGTFNQVLNVVDATQDQIVPSLVSLTGTSANPGLMVLSPNNQRLLVFSTSGNTIAVVDTTTESVASSASSITLLDTTQSIAVSADNETGYAAVPSAPVTSSPPSPGVLEQFSLSSGNITAKIPVPGVFFVAVSHNGNRVLALGTQTCPDNTSAVTVISPSLIGSSQDPRTVVCGFDHPAWAAFSSDDTLAYVLDCGPECGGLQAGVTRLNLNTNIAEATVALAGGATVGLLSTNTLYVAGTPPGTPCGSGTAASTCGTVETVDVGSMSVTSGSPTLITDGHHDRMGMGSNGQLFIGATGCTSVNSGGEVRGCLSIFDINKSSVVIPPDNGDVTGIQPITNRNVVYVCQNANFRVYDTTTDKVVVIPAKTNDIQFVGQAIDVKLVD